MQRTRQITYEHEVELERQRTAEKFRKLVPERKPKEQPGEQPEAVVEDDPDMCCAGCRGHCGYCSLDGKLGAECRTKCKDFGRKYNDFMHDEYSNRERGAEWLRTGRQV